MPIVPLSFLSCKGTTPLGRTTAICRIINGYTEEEVGMLTQFTVHCDRTAVFTFWIDHCDGRIQASGW